MHREPAKSARPAVTPEQALIGAGLAEMRGLRQGRALLDKTAPSSPRSLSQPVRFERGADGVLRLYLSTPACASLPFVGRVEALTGLVAVWDEERRMPAKGSGADMRFAHAFDLARDEDWKCLADTLEHTTVEDVEQAAIFTLMSGMLSPENARGLLLRVGLPEPDGCSVEHLKGLQPVNGCPSGLERLGAWAIVHGLEDGWYKLEQQTRGRPPLLLFTAEGYQRVGTTPPAVAA